MTIHWLDAECTLKMSMRLTGPEMIQFDASKPYPVMSISGDSGTYAWLLLDLMAFRHKAVSQPFALDALMSKRLDRCLKRSIGV